MREGGGGGSAVFAEEAAGASPDELQAGKNGDKRDRVFELFSWHAPRQQAAEHHAENPALQQANQYGAVNRAERPMKRAADHGQDEAEEQISADHLRRRHLLVVQQQHGAERSRSGRRETRFHPDGQGQPRQPFGIAPGKTRVLRFRRKRHARRGCQQEAEQYHDNLAIRIAAQQGQQESAKQQAGNSSLQQEPEIAQMKVLAREIEGRGDQSHDTRVNESGADRRPGGQTNQQDQRGHGEAAASNAG